MKLVTKEQRPNPLNTVMVMELIQDLVNSEELDIFIRTEKEDLIRLHHTLGRHIRNTYIYSNEDFMKSYDGEHIDDVSFEIIEELHSILNDLKNNGEDIDSLGKERNKEN